MVTFMNGVSITGKISSKNLQSYAKYIPAEDYPLIEDDRAFVLGINSDDGSICGAIVAEIGREPDDGDGNILIIDQLDLDAASRNRKVYNELIDRLLETARKRKLSGIVMQTVYPEDTLMEDVLEKRAERLEDGNTIYESEIKTLIQNPVIRRDFRDTDRAVISIACLNRSERDAFLDGWGRRFPVGLSPKLLPGKWLEELSFVCREGDEYTGFILASEMSEDLLYIGAIYAKKHDGQTAGALIKGLCSEAMQRISFYKRVMFAASSDEGKKLCQYLTRDVKKVSVREIHYYYLEV